MQSNHHHHQLQQHQHSDQPSINPQDNQYRRPNPRMEQMDYQRSEQLYHPQHPQHTHQHEYAPELNYQYKDQPYHENQMRNHPNAPPQDPNNLRGYKPPPAPVYRNTDYDPNQSHMQPQHQPYKPQEPQYDPRVPRRPNMEPQYDYNPQHPRQQPHYLNMEDPQIPYSYYQQESQPRQYHPHPGSHQEPPEFHNSAHNPQPAQRQLQIQYQNPNRSFGDNSELQYTNHHPQHELYHQRAPVNLGYPETAAQYHPQQLNTSFQERAQGYETTQNQNGNSNFKSQQYSEHTPVKQGNYLETSFPNSLHKRPPEFENESRDERFSNTIQQAQSSRGQEYDHLNQSYTKEEAPYHVNLNNRMPPSNPFLNQPHGAFPQPYPLEYENRELPYGMLYAQQAMQLSQDIDSKKSGWNMDNPNLQKNFKSDYLPTDPNKPFTPERVLSDSDEEYRIDLNEERLTRLYRIGMRIVRQKGKNDKKRQKVAPAIESQSSGSSQNQSTNSQDSEQKSLNQLKLELKTEMDLLKQSLSLESVSEGENIDFLEKNKVALSLAPLKKVKVDETASTREPFQIKGFAKNTQTFFSQSCHYALVPVETPSNLEENLVIEETQSRWQGSSDSEKSELSQKHFREEILETKIELDLAIKKKSETSESGKSEQLCQAKQIQNNLVKELNISGGKQEDLIATGEPKLNGATQEIEPLNMPAHEIENIGNKPDETLPNVQNNVIPQVPEVIATPANHDNSQLLSSEQNFGTQNADFNSQSYPRNIPSNNNPSVPPLESDPNTERSYPNNSVGNAYAWSPMQIPEGYGADYYHQQTQQNQEYYHSGFNNMGYYDPSYQQPGGIPFESNQYRYIQNRPNHPNLDPYQQQYSTPNQGSQNSIKNPQGYNGYFGTQEEQELLAQPRLTEEELQEFFSMYPYMSDYPYEEVHKFWYKNIKNLTSCVHESDQSPDQEDLFQPGQPNLIDQSIDSEQIKEEYRRKRKRPNKNKKRLRKDTGDINNMIDNISEFSRSSFRPVIPRSEIENVVSRSSSIRSLQKSVPHKILAGKDIKSAASGSMHSIEGPKTTLTEKKSDRKGKTQIAKQLVDMKYNINTYVAQASGDYGPSYSSKEQNNHKRQVRQEKQHLSYKFENETSIENQFIQQSYLAEQIQGYQDNFDSSDQDDADCFDAEEYYQNQMGNHVQQNNQNNANGANLQVPRHPIHYFHNNQPSAVINSQPNPKAGNKQTKNMELAALGLEVAQFNQNKMRNEISAPLQGLNNERLISHLQHDFEDKIDQDDYYFQEDADLHQYGNGPNNERIQTPKPPPGKFPDLRQLEQQQFQFNNYPRENQYLAQDQPSQGHMFDANAIRFEKSNSNQIQTRSIQSPGHQNQRLFNQGVPPHFDSEMHPHRPKNPSGEYRDLYPKDAGNQPAPHYPINTGMQNQAPENIQNYPKIKENPHHGQIQQNQPRPKIGPMQNSKPIYPHPQDTSNLIEQQYDYNTHTHPPLQAYHDHPYPSYYPGNIPNQNLANYPPRYEDNLQANYWQGEQNQNQIANQQNFDFQQTAQYQQQPLNQVQETAIGDQSSPLIDTAEISIVEQCRHKNHTGRLQRRLREMTDAQRLDLFKQIKPHFLEIVCDPYGKYVASLFLGFNLTPIIDATISMFDKNLKRLSSDQYAIKFCQKLIETKFKDKRLRKSLNKMFEEMEFYVLDQNAALCVLSFVNQAVGPDLKELAEFCKQNITMCIENETLGKIVSKLLKKVSKSLNAELILYLRQVVIELIRQRKGKDLVEVFFDHAGKEDRAVVLDYIIPNSSNLIFDMESQYLFFKIVDLQLLETIDGILDCVLRDSDSLNNFSELVNKCVSSRNLQILSLKVSKQYKEELKNRLVYIQQQGEVLTDSGKQFQDQIRRYFNHQLSEPLICDIAMLIGFWSHKIARLGFGLFCQN